MAKVELVTIDAKIIAETEKAFGIDSGKINEKTGQILLIWLPKSQVSEEGRTSLTMPVWLALDKGLI